MRIKRLRLRNFRCFGDKATTVSLKGFSTLVGANGCGKSAVLEALVRMFGVSIGDRTLQPADFYLPPGKNRDDLKKGEMLSLVLEAWLEFPELAEKHPKADTSAIPSCFRQMIVPDSGAAPRCRIRLAATWTKSNLPDGEIEQTLHWVTSEDDDPKEKDLKPMPAHDRSRIHVHYVPASRDPVRQIRYVSGSIVNRLFNAAEWSPNVRNAIGDASTKIRKAFADEPGVAKIEEALQQRWRALHAASMHSTVSLRPVAQRLEEIFKHVEAIFGPAPGSADQDLDRLSDGLKSLFYLSMVGAAFDIETGVVRDDPNVKRLFSPERLDPPALTVFAVEEPENHVSPHYLGRINSVFRKLVETGRGQVVLTSHSPAILERVAPEEIRYLRLDPKTGITGVRRIPLPEAGSDAYKFVRQAVRSYPELYFSSLVILGEGDSESIVLPRVAAALGIELDNSFISVVPLGGRHVNHFWRLLSGLNIPHITLLDLDQERYGGGWGRIQYVLRELIALGVDEGPLLKFSDDKGKTRSIAASKLDSMSSWDVADTEALIAWRKHLEKRAIFFAGPLDLDFLMLQAFHSTYAKVPEGADGPEIPGKGAKDRDAELEQVIKAVLKPKGGTGKTYSAKEIEAFFWYRYHFLNRGKPATHLDAMARLTDEELAKGCPPVLRRLCDAMSRLLSAGDVDDDVLS
jgi:putative ATP-dependent endonuclease of OLD family